MSKVLSQDASIIMSFFWT